MKNSISVKVLELAIILIKFLWIGGVQRVVAICDIPAIFVFGDSLSDTGNCALSQTPSDIAFCNRTRDLPYGETFPRHGFLRFSDGLLIVDWLSSSLGLEFIPPYFDKNASFKHGINFAFSGAPALPTGFLNSMGIFPLTNVSLGDEISWYLRVKAKIASSPYKIIPGKPTLDSFDRGLYIMEIGGNDYLSAFAVNKTPDYVNKNLVPLVAQKIRTSIEILYKTGARKFLLITITPFGCVPFVLATFNGTKDKYGCLIEYNSVSYNHGRQVLGVTEYLRETYQDASFTLLDYFGAYHNFLEHNFEFGFIDTLDACCGAGPAFPYNFNPLLFCSANSFVCPIPKTYLNWDGFHFTHAFNLQVFQLTIIKGFYLNPLNAFEFCYNS